jgi:hypothetical protein
VILISAAIIVSKSHIGIEFKYYCKKSYFCNSRFTGYRIIGYFLPAAGRHVTLN